jgi:hypothetical protein
LANVPIEFYFYTGHVIARGRFERPQVDILRNSWVNELSSDHSLAVVNGIGGVATLTNINSLDITWSKLKKMYSLALCTLPYQHFCTSERNLDESQSARLQHNFG